MLSIPPEPVTPCEMDRLHYQLFLGLLSDNDQPRAFPAQTKVNNLPGPHEIEGEICDKGQLSNYIKSSSVSHELFLQDHTVPVDKIHELGADVVDVSLPPHDETDHFDISSEIGSGSDEDFEHFLQGGSDDDDDSMKGDNCKVSSYADLGSSGHVFAETGISSPGQQLCTKNVQKSTIQLGYDYQNSMQAEGKSITRRESSNRSTFLYNPAVAMSKPTMSNPSSAGSTKDPPTPIQVDRSFARPEGAMLKTLDRFYRPFSSELVQGKNVFNADALSLHDRKSSATMHHDMDFWAKLGFDHIKGIGGNPVSSTLSDHFAGKPAAMTVPCTSEANHPPHTMSEAVNFAGHQSVSLPTMTSQGGEEPSNRTPRGTSMLTSHSDCFSTVHSIIDGHQTCHQGTNVENDACLPCAPEMASSTMPISSSVDNSALNHWLKQTPTTKYSAAYSRTANENAFLGDGVHSRSPSTNFEMTIASTVASDRKSLPITLGSSLCHKPAPSHSALTAIIAAETPNHRIPLHDPMPNVFATARITTDEKKEILSNKRHRSSVVSPAFALSPLSSESSALAAVENALPVMESAAKRLCLESNFNQFSGERHNQDAKARNASPQATFNKPADSSDDKEWFEGVLPLSLPDDPEYFSEFHCLIRANLELFSASAAEAGDSNAGRRTLIVRGKVGIRCIHCARAVWGPASPDTSANNANSFTSIKTHRSENCNTASYVKRNKGSFAGSVSYPINIAGLYPLCSQKPALHFEKCRNLPIEVKKHFYRLTHDKHGRPQRQRHSVGTASGGIITNKTSPVKCYFIAAKRVGLVDVFGGIRFGRDLTFAPLPIEEVLARYHQHSQSSIERRGTERISTKTLVPFINNNPLEPVDHFLLRPVSQNAEPPTITAKEESERVLEEAIADCDDRSLLKSEDKLLVTDFVFLCTAQMAVCHATQADFPTRAKKTKSMRLKLAGFCCQHCSNTDWTLNDVHAVDTSCGSFASTPDDLASVICNSFHAHLQKCCMIPSKVKSALKAFERLHAHQMLRLPDGSHKRFFHSIWSRLRQADISRFEKREKQYAPTEQQKRDAAEWKSLVSEEKGNKARDCNGSYLPVVFSADAATAKKTPYEYPPHFLRCEGVLASCVSNEAAMVKSKENDKLLMENDMPLILSFVLLLVKPAKTIHPTLADSSRGKRSHTFKMGMTEFCCKYCAPEDQMWSFSSASDIFSFSSNASMLLQHLLKCESAPLGLKQSLQKLLSGQMSLLQFGSQRKLFELVFARLSTADLSFDCSSLQKGADAGSEIINDRNSGFDLANKTDLKKHGFTKNSGGWYSCMRCRMVPFDLRAEGSLTESRPTVNFLSAHRAICKGDNFDLGQLTTLVGGMAENNDAFVPDMIVTSAFKNAVHALVGGNTALVHAFTHELHARLNAQNEDMNDECTRTEGLWNKFPTFVNNKEVHSALDEFIASVNGLSPVFLCDENFVKFMQIVSPSYLDRGNFDDDEDEASNDNHDVKIKHEC